MVEARGWEEEDGGEREEEVEEVGDGPPRIEKSDDRLGVSSLAGSFLTLTVVVVSRLLLELSPAVLSLELILLEHFMMELLGAQLRMRVEP